ncbi:MAG: DUF2325 domain-containing protein [Pseudomonadota bacterium]
MCQLPHITPEGARRIKLPQLSFQNTAALKFWEIDKSFKCPIVGMCLTTSEQKQLLKKTGLLKNKSPYEIHEILVSCAESENILSQKVDRLLNHKFGDRVAALHRLSEQELMRGWQAAFETGHYFAELWAAVSRPDLSAASGREIFGAVHMAMHTGAGQLAVASRRLELLQEKAAAQNLKTREIQMDRRTLKKENDTLKRLLAEVTNRLRYAEQEKKRLGDELADIRTQPRMLELESENRRLCTAVTSQTGLLEIKDRKLTALTEHIARVSKELEDHRQTEVLLREETQATLNTFFAMNRCDPNCPAFDLCQKRVLIVGGIARMETLYRQLIENNGGFFEYHDGHMKGGAKQLENSLKRSDIVLCPVNCNSHAACAAVKNLGKKHHKPVHMLASFSLSTVSQIIRSGGGTQAERNG